MSRRVGRWRLLRALVHLEDAGAGAVSGAALLEAIEALRRASERRRQSRAELDGR